MNTLISHIIELRHKLHAHPELSFQEHATCALLCGELDSRGIKHQVVANTGVLAICEGAKAGGDILLRADIDALPIVESNALPYCSTNGAMHACGHDIHTAVLLGTLFYLSEHPECFAGRVIGLFQPGEEESPGGASIVLGEGVLDKFNIKKAYALHTAHDMPVGYFGARSGEYMASTSEIHLTVRGEGSHAALPAEGHNAIVDSAKIILALNELKQKYKNVIISIGHITAKGATNIVPSEVTLAGTLRALTSSLKEELKQEIKNLAEQLNPQCIISFTDGYPPVYNNEELATESITTLKNTFGDDKVVSLGLRMTADDFGFIAERYPSFYFRLGVQGDWKHNAAPHTPHFLADDKAILYGIEAFISFLKA